jgi:pathogenesis-related protein 1
MRLLFLLFLGAAWARSASVDAKALVEAHNRARAKHCAPPLKWSSKLAASAQKWADNLGAHGCGLQHSGGPHGENLAAGSEGFLDAAAVVGMWVDEGRHYKGGGFSMKTGHFTQVVWHATREVGCARARCSGLEVWVCQYDPPGNVEGQYRENVGCR